MGVMDRKPRAPGRPLATTMLAGGTRLYHGTRCVGGFDVPDGPAWFAFGPGEARGWCDWSDEPPKGRTHGEARVLAYEVVTDVELVDTRTLAGWRALGRRLARDEDPLVDEIARAVAEAGMQGWHGRAEAMLVEPGAWLRRVDLTPDEVAAVGAWAGGDEAEPPSP